MSKAWVAFALWSLASVGARAGTLTITAPTEGAKLSARTDFEVKVDGLPNLAGLVWRLNGRDLGGPLTVAPYRLAWFPEIATDGPYELQVVALGDNGRELAVSPPVHFTVSRGLLRSALVTAPDLSKPLAGIARVTIAVDMPMTQEEIDRWTKAKVDVKPIEAVMCFVDGLQVAHFWGSGAKPPHVVSFDLDTTQFANGPHELSVSAFGREDGAPRVALIQQQMVFANGHAPLRLQPRFRDVFLKPGGNLPLVVRLACTDGASDPIAGPLDYASDKPAVATVDAAGKIVAVAPGVATVTVTQALPPATDAKPDAKPRNRQATVRVVVMQDLGLPHFTRDGRMVQRYEPGQSLFVRTYFNFQPRQLQDHPDLPGLTKDAGVNVLTTGFFSNPNDGNHINTIEAYSKAWDSMWADNARLDRHDYPLLLTGDDLVRTRNELAWTATNPIAHDVVKYVFGRLAASKRVIGIEMMDEASFLGAGPGQLNPGILNGDPPIPADALGKLVDWIREVPGSPPLTWPVLGLSGPEGAGNWMGNPRYSDYATQYSTWMDWRQAYPWGGSLPQLKGNLDRVMSGRFPWMQPDRPVLMLTGTTGPYYRKLGPGSDFTPGQDKLLGPGATPVQTTAAAMFGAIAGGAGERAYGADFFWKPEREHAKPDGNNELQSGAGPYDSGSDIWHAEAAAWRTLGRLEPWLLQDQANAIDLGPLFSTGARHCPQGDLLLALNWSEKPQTVTVDLSPYRHGRDAPAIELCRVGSGTYSVFTMPGAASDKVTFRPGETIIWLCRAAAPPQDPRPTPPAVSFTAPLPEATVTGQVTLRAEATSQSGLKQVEFFVNGKSLGTATKAPYVTTWDTATATAGTWYSLTAVATDRAGHSSEARTMVRVAPPQVK